MIKFSKGNPTSHRCFHPTCRVHSSPERENLMATFCGNIVRSFSEISLKYLKKMRTNSRELFLAMLVLIDDVWSFSKNMFYFQRKCTTETCLALSKHNHDQHFSMIHSKYHKNAQHARSREPSPKSGNQPTHSLTDWGRATICCQTKNKASQTNL